MCHSYLARNSELAGNPSDADEESRNESITSQEEYFANGRQSRTELM